MLKETSFYLLIWITPCSWTVQHEKVMCSIVSAMAIPAVEEDLDKHTLTFASKCKVLVCKWWVSFSYHPGISGKLGHLPSYFTLSFLGEKQNKCQTWAVNLECVRSMQTPRKITRPCLCGF